MLDLGLSKMALIGVVALVVLGPERLPRVARTAGALFGRAQRYINDVKAEVSREIELDALRTMKTDFEQAARNVENTIHDNLREHERDLNAAWNSAVSPGGSAAADAPDGPSAASGEPSWRTMRRAGEAPQLAREKGGDARLVQARDDASHAGAIGCRTRRATSAGEPAPPRAFPLIDASR